MRFPRVKVLVLLLALFNVAGSPMAWANWLGESAPHATAAAATDAEPACHGHAMASPGQPSPAPDSMPCCQDGHCACAVPALTLPLVLQITRVPHPPLLAGAELSALPADPLDDPLRPPIR